VCASMKLSECLIAAEIKTMRNIALHYQFTCSKHSKLDLHQEILYAFQNKKFLKDSAVAWVKGRDEAMIRLCLDYRSVFTVEELEGLFSKTEDAVIPKAMAEGWLYPTTKFGGRMMYCIPEEIKLFIHQTVIDGLAQRIKQSSEGPLIYREDGHAMVRDVEVFLEYLRHHDVSITQEGTMYKRNLQQVLALVEHSEVILEGGWRFGYGRRFHDYPNRFSLLYDYAHHAGLVWETENLTLQVTELGLQWPLLSQLERHRELVKFYLSLYRRPILRLPQIVRIIANVAERWVNSNSLLSSLGQLVNAYYYDTVDDVWHRRIIEMMTSLGLIRTGQDENFETWFQITNLGQQLLTPDANKKSAETVNENHRILIVQPNFDIVVTADNGTVTTELSHFTDLKKSGAIRTYRISQDSVARGLNKGQSLKIWLDFLQQHAHTAIPGNVERTLVEWDKAWQAVHDDALSS